MKKGTKKKVYCNEYYEKNRKEILKKMKEEYFRKRKKTPKCKCAGKNFPKNSQHLRNTVTNACTGKGTGKMHTEWRPFGGGVKINLTKRKKTSRI